MLFKKLILFVLYSIIGTVQAQPPLTLEQLMSQLAAVSTIEGYFREQKHFAMLDQPLLQTGVLHYRAPDYLRKQTLLPQPEVLEVDGHSLRLDSAEYGQRELMLNDYPPLRAFVESFRGVLAGDLTTLRRHYRVQLSGRSADWTLQLQPLAAELAETVETLLIRGQDAQVLSLETHEPDGDFSLMTITPSTP